MELIYVLLNALAYLLLPLSYWRMRKKMDVYMMISSMYAFTAVMSCFYFVLGGVVYPDLGLLAFIYLFVALLLFLAPIRNFNISKKQITINDNKWFKLLSLIYILLSFYVIFTLATHTSELIESGMWAEMRNTGLNVEREPLYKNAFQKFTMNTVGYLKPFALVYAFYLLSKPKINIFLILGMFISLFITSFMFAAADASRGMVVSLLIELVICYLLFRGLIPSSRKKIILIIATWVGYGFGAFLVAVSISRFGSEVWEYLFMYLGHSMLTFNDGVFYNLQDYAWGKRFFDFYYDLFGWNRTFDIAAHGSTAGSGFITFVGSLFLDFGPYGTLLVALVAIAVIKPFFEKKIMQLSDIIMIVFYANTMANGIFVSSANRALIWTMTFVVYLVVKCIEMRVTTKTSIKSSISVMTKI